MIWFLTIIGVALALVAVQLFAPSLLARFSQKFRDKNHESHDSSPGGDIF